MEPSLDQHNLEIAENRRHWERKPLLRIVYNDLYLRIIGHLRRDLEGPTIELGSGIGHIKEVLPDCVTTDIFPNPWIDRVETAYRLTCADGKVSNFIMFHIFHHLRYPGTALNEIRRALLPGGRAVILDPYISLLGSVVYGKLHHEAVAMSDPIEPYAPSDFAPDDDTYYAAQGNATRIFWRGEIDSLLDGWRVVAMERPAGIAYILSGGYSKPQMYPTSVFRIMKGVDRICGLLPALFATCLLIVLEKE